MYLFKLQIYTVRHFRIWTSANLFSKAGVEIHMCHIKICRIYYMPMRIRIPEPFLHYFHCQMWTLKMKSLEYACIVNCGKFEVDISNWRHKVSLLAHRSMCSSNLWYTYEILSSKKWTFVVIVYRRHREAGSSIWYSYRLVSPGKWIHEGIVQKQGRKASSRKWFMFRMIYWRDRKVACVLFVQTEISSILF